MMKIIVAVVVLGMAAGAWAQETRKPCDELKGEIEAKIKKNGVEKFSLDVLEASAEARDGKVVGTCDGGTKKIVYKRG